MPQSRSGRWKRISSRGIGVIQFPWSMACSSWPLLTLPVGVKLKLARKPSCPPEKNFNFFKNVNHDLGRKVKKWNTKEPGTMGAQGGSRAVMWEPKLRPSKLITLSILATYR
ncbi:hypothetical protein KIL84_014338 [Mauremys mutica]|uniref:Uncharacterized protein n=1 Tax=Mauremys mutica TaxID=74926 RepID=A0A9D3XQ08_9SAUR|nr:hypothetical protein KIL84_014338 [Mauremys mutica]